MNELDDSMTAKRKGLDNISQAIDERDKLVEKWNKQSSIKSIFPTEKWDIDRRNKIPATFGIPALLIAVICVIIAFPGWLFAPYLIYLFIERNKLKKEICKKQSYINAIIPISLKEEDYNIVRNTEIGKKFIRNKICFKAHNYTKPLSK